LSSEYSYKTYSIRRKFDQAIDDIDVINTCFRMMHCGIAWGIIKNWLLMRILNCIAISNFLMVLYSWDVQNNPTMQHFKPHGNNIVYCFNVWLPIFCENKLKNQIMSYFKTTCVYNSLKSFFNFFSLHNLRNFHFRFSILRV